MIKDVVVQNGLLGIAAGTFVWIYRRLGKLDPDSPERPIPATWPGTVYLYNGPARHARHDSGPADFRVADDSATDTGSLRALCQHWGEPTGDEIYEEISGGFNSGNGSVTIQRGVV